MAKSATLDEPEQGEMFPDLDPKKPADKALIAKAKAWARIVDERKKTNKDGKQREDEAHEEMVAAAHAAGIKVFKLQGRKIEIETREKAKIESAEIEDDASDEE